MSLTPLTYLMMKQQEKRQKENSLHGCTTQTPMQLRQISTIEQKFYDSFTKTGLWKPHLAETLGLMIFMLLIICYNLVPRIIAFLR